MIRIIDTGQNKKSKERHSLRHRVRSVGGVLKNARSWYEDNGGVWHTTCRWTSVVIVLLVIPQRDWRGKGLTNHTTKGLVR